MALLLLAGPARALLEVPKLSARVQDAAGLLSAEEERALSARLEQFERETRHQIVVLSVPSLEGEAIESFAMRVAEAWKLGDARFDNGVLVVVSSKDRRARIEVGYGLEGVLPDALAARILRDYMIPEFAAGAMGRGVERGVDAIMAAARNEALPPVPDKPRRRENGENGENSFLGGVFFAAIFGSLFGSGVGRKRGGLAALVGGGVAGTLGFLITFSLGLALLAAFFGGLFGALNATGILGSSALGRGGRHYGSGGFGGGFGGGGFGGGFGGGGGGFGGGGASGSW